MILKTIVHPGKQFARFAFSFIFLALLFVPSLTFAQGKTITGKVTGSDGKPIEGVTVQEQSSKTGAATDVSGNFSLNVSDPNAVLTVSSLGYAAQTISLGGRSNISIRRRCKRT